MGCCRSMARGYLIGLNVITLLLGIVGLGGAIYVLVEYKDFDELFSRAAVIVACVAGALIAVVSLIGCVSAKQDIKCGMAFYATGMMILIACQIAAAIFAAIYLGYLDDVQNSDASAIVKQTQADINDWELTTYNYCCFNDPNNCPASAGCVKAQLCEGTDDPACIINPNFASLVSVDVCTALSKVSASFPYDKDASTVVTLTGKVVGDATVDYSTSSAACGGGTPAGFRSQIYNWFKANQKIFTIISASIAAIETLAVVFACTLVCSKKDAEYAHASSKEQDIEASNLTGVSIHQPAGGMQSGGGVRYN